ncbi:MAG: F0F1 ATP synthase subunit delta [Gordonia sp. (in: high G+C Gram-positive bacteria)]|uniref:F0F1 ATP synthase subunit delta n=1 Tax=Gordonia sp. (in: high G+C Gram-positive bacteria) TaxID=84139 RepID=UPI003BB8136B
MYAASSREALEGARVELETALRGVTGTDDIAIGEELMTVADTVGSDRALRTALADSSTSPDARAAVATAVLTGKVHDVTRNMVASAAARHWSRDGDLARALQALGREALLLAAKREGRLDVVEAELFRLASLVKDNPAFELALSDRSRSREDRRTLLAGLIGGKVDDVTERLAVQAVLVGHQAPGDALDEISGLAAATNGRKVAYVTSAGELSAKQRTELAQKLSRIFDAPVTLHVEIDPELLGGVVVRVGDERIDGSIAGKLAALRRDMQ